jgi:ferrous iron transport protein A
LKGGGLVAIEKPLSEMPIGTVGTVIENGLTGLTKRRLMDLGFIPGSKIEVLRKSPAGDPTAYYVRGTIIALRNNEASHISIIPHNKF